ncbi:hypothetical protein STG2_97 [Salmonella phage STG2]|uniref:Uncharacterized protein n=1 Tax=Salmonella phage STG2 TaxID=2480623 RepID=A0A3G2KAN1_9CAUD|nr:hypothetical protein HOU44_gp138 [Salmonella phage STG2]AYN56061.1 hypothetical protein STG2_97 [Salmonella phage STG2]
MHVFEFRNKNPNRRVLIIGETYRAYEQEDGSVLLNDEKQGYSFHPEETYEEFRKQFSLDWRKLVTSSSLPASISMSSL